MSEQFKHFISQKTIGFQNNDEGKIAYDIQECVVRWQDGTTQTVWRMWDVNIPFTRDKYYTFLLEKPRIDIPCNTGKIHTSF